MVLKEYIELLKKFNPEQRVPVGLGNPHSWRGSYDELSFEPVEDTTIGAMLATAEDCVGRTFGGWKGGDFTMTEYTTIHVDYRGRCSDVGQHLLIFLLCNSAEIPSGIFEAVKADRKYNDEAFSYTYG